MEKTRDTKKELKNLREEVMLCFKETTPSKKFGPMVVMAIVGLHMIEAKIHKTLDIEERRRLINEFKRGKKGIERGIKAHRQSCSGCSKDHGEKFRRAVS